MRTPATSASGQTTANSQLSLGGYNNIGMTSGNSSSYITHQYLATSGQDCLSLACNFIRSDSASGLVAFGGIGTAEIQITGAGVGSLVDLFRYWRYRHGPERFA